MPETVKGFQTTEGTKKYDYKSLANLPEKAADYIGLDKVDNTSDMEKPVSTAQKNAIDQALKAAKEYAEQLSFNGSGGSDSTTEIVYVTMGNDLEDLTSSHTAKQIMQAAEAGRVPFCALVIGNEVIAFFPSVLSQESVIFTTIMTLEDFVILTLTISEEKNSLSISPFVTAIPDNYVTSSELTNEVNSALAQAKENGDFKGEPGNDYILTEADKKGVANIVLNMLPTWNGGSY